MRQDRERAREEAAREKARERERRLEARNAAILSSAEELERKIQLKVQPLVFSFSLFPPSHLFPLHPSLPLSFPSSPLALISTAR